MSIPANDKGQAASGFVIAEIENGLTVVEIHGGETPEDAAVRNHGVLVDPGPYPTYEEAYDALMEIDADDEEEAD